MAAVLQGTTGNWSITTQETGLLVQSFESDNSQDVKKIKGPGGHDIGGAYYNQMMAISVSAYVEKDGTPTTQKLASELVLANAPALDHMPDAVAGFGMTILEGVKRGRQVEDFESHDMEAVYQPYFKQAA